MTKISAEEKLATVQRYLKGKESSRTVAADIGVFHGYLLTWVKQYEHNSVEVFVNCSKQFKLDVLNYLIEHSTSLYETAAIFSFGNIKIV